MASARSFDAELSAVDSIASLPPEEALPAIPRALSNRSNLIVSRAAKHAARLNLTSLAPELAEAFYRFLPPADAVKTDPQCWAKNELSKALAQFEHQDSELFLRGLQHHQLEPVWGGESDTAGALRGTCALALVQCREMNSYALLRHLVPLFRDVDMPVRVNAARAVEQVGSDAAVLLLRLRAELGSDDPQVIGACLSGVLHVEGDAALPWVASFVKPPGKAEPDDISAEAAFVLAEHRTPEAVVLLQQAYTAMARSRNYDFRATLLQAIAATRLPEATEWLLARVSAGSLDARDAAEALCAAQPAAETAARLSDLGFPCKNG